MRQPKLLAKIWAAIGLKNTIPESRESGIAQGAATYDDGFPAITMTPIAQGGKAPSGKDMNGILHELSAHIVHMNQGGHYKFDATFAERINGYSKGAVLINNDETAFFVSLVNQNKTDFNRGEDYARYWVKLADIDALKQINPKDLTEETTNQKDHTGHTHRLPLASLIKKGIAQLYTGYDSQREDLALTPKTAYLLKALIDSNSRSLNDRIPNSKKSNSTTSNSSDTVATSKAAKTAYDKGVDAKNAADNANTNANGRVSKSGDTMTGDLTARNLNATSGIKSGYRLLIERNESNLLPYVTLHNLAIDVDNLELTGVKSYASVNFNLPQSGVGKIKSQIVAQIRDDKSTLLKLMATDEKNVLKNNLVAFGKTGNVAIGKTQDSGERLQVEGDISATKPINIKHKGWEKVRATHADGSYWRWETHPDGGSTDNSSRFNFVLTTARRETKYVSFPNVAGDSETVAYQSWVNNALDMLVGIPLPYPLTDVPSRYLPMIGQPFDKSRYPKLAKKYPSGVLPDLRAEFIRGWDNGRGVDRGRALLSSQGDAIRNITGYGRMFTAEDNNTGSGAINVSTYMNSGRAAGAGGRGLQFDFDASRVVPTADENRPRNIAFQYICLAG